MCLGADFDALCARRTAGLNRQRSICPSCLGFSHPVAILSMLVGCESKCCRFALMTQCHSHCSSHVSMPSYFNIPLPGHMLQGPLSHRNPSLAILGLGCWGLRSLWLGVHGDYASPWQTDLLTISSPPTDTFHSLMCPHYLCFPSCCSRLPCRLPGARRGPQWGTC